METCKDRVKVVRYYSTKGSNRLLRSRWGKCRNVGIMDLRLGDKKDETRLTRAVVPASGQQPVSVITRYLEKNSESFNCKENVEEDN